MINRLKFSIDINASNSTIWNVLWNEEQYREWAAVFFEGSYVISNNWEEGKHVHFLAPDKSGIYSLVEKHIPDEFIRFKHIGAVKDGKEQAPNEDSKKWSGANEIYSLSEAENGNTLHIEIDVMDEHLDFMKETFPKALEKIKENCLGVRVKSEK